MNEFNLNGGSVELLDQLKTKRPKKALSAYMIFVRENRWIISEASPELTALEVMKEVGQRWQNLTEQEKQLYEDKANRDKKRFKKDLAKFEKEIEDMSVSSPTKFKVNEENKIEMAEVPKPPVIKLKSKLSKVSQKPKLKEEAEVSEKSKKSSKPTVPSKSHKAKGSGRK